MAHTYHLLLWGIYSDSLALLAAMFRSHGFRVSTITDAAQFIPTLDATVDLVVLDLSPQADLGLIAELRDVFTRPMVIISAYRNDRMMVRALEQGADDVISRPFRIDELIARIRALLRRYARSQHSVLNVGPLTLDWHTRTVRLHGHLITIDPTEYALLMILATHPQRPFAPALLLRRLWGEPALNTPEQLTSIIYNLRMRLEYDPAAPTLIAGDFTRGFWLAEEEKKETGV